MCESLADDLYILSIPCRTFSELSKPADLYKKCEELCESLADDLTEEEMKVRITHCKNC